MAEPAHMSINKIQELSVLMLAASKADDWGLLEKLESQRKTVMHHFFEATGISTENALEIKSVIEAVLEIDKEIIGLCAAEADDCQRQLAGFKQGRKAIAAYSANS